MIKKSKIVIYTRGLANSPAWKMAEYLSQGKVIIAEKLSTELVNPLTDGKEVLFFENHHDLIDKINLVLFNEELSSKLSLNAKKYFEDVVHPKQNIKRIINLMLQHKTIE
jgi:glycosyltransferase involved in cell wall biosynthesis